MIQNSTDLIKHINIEETISLTPEIYALKSPLIIGNTFEILGNGSTLVGPILICTDIIISDITFSNTDNIIRLTSDCSVVFKNCTFLGNNKNSAIILENHSKSILSLKNCIFHNFFSAISVNEDNTLDLLQDCLFEFCNVAINNVVKNSIINIHSINNNLMFNSKESIFLNFSESFNIEDYHNFCFELSSRNSFARILGKSSTTVFDTSCFYIDNLKNLSVILKSCPHCSTIFLKEGQYNLTSSLLDDELTIDVPINLIGINSPKLYKSENDFIKYAIIINTSNVRIKNIVIDGGDKYSLRDGIHFEENGATNIKIQNVTISRILRRGVSIWGKKTSNCIIDNCKFSYIKEQCAIYASGTTYIYNSNFKNLRTAINCINKNVILFENNLFENIYCCLLNEIIPFNNIKQKNNTFNFVENLVMLSKY
ncbi:hypothetical protein DWV13_12515 [Clostridium botulinum]|uniref:hypothetical protein n=1 Tax=Clostridium TaxID=1485 RepID=UPI0013F96C4A|nr:MULTISPECIES: hypothetical protein [Clostridium]MCS6132437.1 hypothetical protein [Clostridium botulinum]NFL46013.1 hypothetical protein [Clostridium botulinum]NFL90057.1 hypothetical protein [Clostridium botulinum]